MDVHDDCGDAPGRAGSAGPGVRAHRASGTTPAERRRAALATLNAQRKARAGLKAPRPATPAIVDALEHSQKTRDAMLGYNKKTAELLAKGMVSRLG